MIKTNKTVLSLGGSLIVPPSGINLIFLKRFKKIVLEYIQKGNRLLIVCGGGSICRVYQKASQKLTPVTPQDKDWIGIMATRLNAELIRVMFKDFAPSQVIYNPHQRINNKKKIIIAAGYKPGCSTDTDAVLLAKQWKAKLIINLTNIDYVYDKDPQKYKTTKKWERLTWSDYQKLISSRFTPGMHAPFDPLASKLAKRYNLKVAIIKGTNLNNLRKLLEGKKFKGTLIEGN